MCLQVVIFRVDLMLLINDGASLTEGVHPQHSAIETLSLTFLVNCVQLIRIATLVTSHRRLCAAKSRCFIPVCQYYHRYDVTPEWRSNLIHVLYCMMEVFPGRACCALVKCRRIDWRRSVWDMQAARRDDVTTALYVVQRITLKRLRHIRAILVTFVATLS